MSPHQAAKERRHKRQPEHTVVAERELRGLVVDVEPVYTTLPGWPGDLTGIRSLDEVPASLLDYVAFIENAVGVPVTVLSVGPDREQTLTLKAVQPVA